MTSSDRAAPLGRMLWGQVRHHNRTFRRNPFGAFFTVVLPLLLLVILGGLFGDSMLIVGERWVAEGEVVPGAVAFAQVITPAMAAFGISMAAFVHLATATAAERADGTLKRLRGTPLPPWVYLSGRILASMGVAGLCAVAVVALGGAMTEMEVRWLGVPAAVLIALVGSISFASLGLMLVALTRPGSVQAVAFGTLLPLAFVSETFLHGASLPPVLSAIGWTFPLRHLSVALRDALDPESGGTGLAWGSLGVMAAWAAAAALVAAARFSWDPVGGPVRGGRRRLRASR